MAKRKYRYRSQKERSIGWLIKTDKRLNDYKTIRGAVSHILSDKQNFKNIVNAIEEQNPGFFTDVQYNENLVELKTSKDKMVNFITGRLEASKKESLRRHKNPSIYSLIKSEFGTEAYLSREKRFALNLNEMYSKRTFERKNGKYVSSKYIYTQEREFFKEKFGTSDLSKLDVKYLDSLPWDMPMSYESMDKGYLIYDKEGNPVIFEMLREQVGDTEYMLNITIQYIENGVWKKIHHKLEEK